MTNLNYKIELLTSCQDHFPALAKLWYEEISRHWAPHASVEKAKQKLIDHLNSKSMPMAYVAICDSEAIGMACLRETDGIRPGFTPWLGSLVVNPKYRGCKVGEALIHTIKDQAKSLGHHILYLLAFDPTISNWYARLGWTRIGDDELFGHRITVMSIPI